MLARIGGMTYQPEDAADSWQRIFGFFGTHLAGGAPTGGGALRESG
jgi:hypothetical protein